MRDVYRKHWRYNRADEPHQRFLRSTPMYAQWDDHEVINDFGAPWTYWNPPNRGRPGFPNLVDEGRKTLFDYNPIARNRVEEDRIYRSFNRGEDADLFVLDARSYRSRNELADTPANDKTMLGRAQLDWIKRGLRESQATWKIVSSDIPRSIPTGTLPQRRYPAPLGRPCG